MEAQQTPLKGEKFQHQSLAQELSKCETNIDYLATPSLTEEEKVEVKHAGSQSRNVSPFLINEASDYHTYRDKAAEQVETVGSLFNTNISLIGHTN